MSQLANARQVTTESADDACSQTSAAFAQVEIRSNSDSQPQAANA